MTDVPMPASHDRSFIAYPIGSDPKFEECLPFTLDQEGGYSNDPHDPGGATMWGIIQKEYDHKRKQWDLPTQWVKKINPDEMRTIYYTDYWMPYSPLMPKGLDLEFFDLCVNGGQHRAVVTLQMALGIADDGQFGPKTINAVTGISDSLKVIEDFKVEREKFYRSLPTFPYFGRGWIRRSEEIAQQGETMEKEPPSA